MGMYALRISVKTPSQSIGRILRPNPKIWPDWKVRTAPTRYCAHKILRVQEHTLFSTLATQLVINKGSIVLIYKGWFNLLFSTANFQRNLT